MKTALRLSTIVFLFLGLCVGSASATNEPIPGLYIIIDNGAGLAGAGGTGTGIPADALFESFGEPSVNGDGHISYLGKWSSRTMGKGAGIFIRIPAGLLASATSVQVARVGGTVAGGMVIKSLGDPVIDGTGGLAFIARLTTTGKPPKAAVVYWDTDGEAVAMEGGPVPDVAPGVSNWVWATFEQVDMTPEGRVLILGRVKVRAGGSTGAPTNANVGVELGSIDFGSLCCTDGTGGLHLLIQTGRKLEQAGGNTAKVTSFNVLKRVPGSQFNSEEVVLKVSFAGGGSALCRIPLP